MLFVSYDLVDPSKTFVDTPIASLNSKKGKANNWDFYCKKSTLKKKQTNMVRSFVLNIK